MNDETNNKRLHLALGRGCWHEYDADREGYFFCMHCGDRTVPIRTSPVYDTDLNLCAEAEKEVIEKVGREGYGYILRNVISSTGNHYVDIALAATASAPDRVEAMLAALEVLKEKRR